MHVKVIVIGKHIGQGAGTSAAEIGMGGIAGGGVGGRTEREEVFVYIRLIHFIIQQRLT